MRMRDKIDFKLCAILVLKELGGRPVKVMALMLENKFRKRVGKLFSKFITNDANRKNTKGVKLVFKHYCYNKYFVFICILSQKLKL